MVWRFACRSCHRSSRGWPVTPARPRSATARMRRVLINILVRGLPKHRFQPVPHRRCEGAATCLRATSCARVPPLVDTGLWNNMT